MSAPPGIRQPGQTSSVAKAREAGRQAAQYTPRCGRPGGPHAKRAGMHRQSVDAPYEPVASSFRDGSWAGHINWAAQLMCPAPFLVPPERGQECACHGVVCPRRRSACAQRASSLTTASQALVRRCARAFIVSAPGYSSATLASAFGRCCMPTVRSIKTLLGTTIGPTAVVTTVLTLPVPLTSPWTCSSRIVCPGRKRCRT